MSTHSSHLSELSVIALDDTHLSDLARLVRDLTFSDQFQRFGRIMRGVAPKRYAASALRRRGILLGAFEYDELIAVGEAVMRTHKDEIIMDGSVVVARCRQGRGLGCAMVGALISAGAARGYSRICLSYPSDCEPMSRIISRCAWSPWAGQCPKSAVDLFVACAPMDTIATTTASIQLAHKLQI